MTIPTADAAPLAGPPGGHGYWWTIAEFAALLVALPLLTFPGRASVFALALLPVVWFARLVWNGRNRAVTPADWPLAGLLLMTLVSMGASVDPHLSLPRLDGLILDFYAFTVVLGYARSARGHVWVASALSVAGVAVALISLVGTNWSSSKLPILHAVYARLPRFVANVPTSSGIVIDGFNPNEVGGTLALLLPVVIALLVFSRAGWVRVSLASVAALLAATLALAASRSADFGVALGVLLIVVLRWRRLALGLPIVTAFVILLSLAVGPGQLAAPLTTTPAVATVGDSLVGRQEVWIRALAEIRDFPLTGIGLNTFPVITDLLYPFFDAPPNARVPHAHNLFLQTAVDLGLPGLVCFLGVLTAAVAGLVRGWQVESGRERAIVAGLAGGLLAHLAFDLTDTVALGAKPSILLWAVLGCAVGMVVQTASLPSGVPRRRDSLVHWSQWCLFTVACLVGLTVTLGSA